MATRYNRMFYIGVTGNLQERVKQHKKRVLSGFTKKFNIIKLVYYEEYLDVYEAIYREKQLKNWHHQWKINLIQQHNSLFKDLSEGWFDYFSWSTIEYNFMIKDRPVYFGLQLEVVRIAGHAKLWGGIYFGLPDLVEFGVYYHDADNYTFRASYTFVIPM